MVQQVAELQKENFGLKLRIYFLENRMKMPLGDNEENINEMVRGLRVQLRLTYHVLSKTQNFIYLFTYLLTYLLTYLFAYLFTYSFSHSFTHLLTSLHSLNHPLIHLVSIYCY